MGATIATARLPQAIPVHTSNVSLLPVISSVIGGVENTFLKGLSMNVAAQVFRHFSSVGSRESFLQAVIVAGGRIVAYCDA